MSRSSLLAVPVAVLLGCLPLAAPTATPAAAAVGLSQISGGRTLFRIQAPALKELSGLAVSDAADAYYAIQDAGNDPVVYVLGPDGRELGALPIPYPDTDWEDISLFRRPGQVGHLYIADTGDASLARARKKEKPRTTFALVRLDEPSVNLPQTLRVAIGATSFPVTFADGGSHNVESILVDPGTERVYLIDKSPKKGPPAGVWQGPAVLSTHANRFERITTLPITGVSSAAYSPGGRFVAVRDAGTAYVWRTDPGGLAATLRGPVTKIVLPSEPQGESLTFTPDGTSLVIGSEGIENPVLAVGLPADLHDPLYPFTTDTPPNRAPLYAGAFLAVVLLLGGGVHLVRRRRSPGR